MIQTSSTPLTSDCWGITAPEVTKPRSTYARVRPSRSSAKSVNERWRSIESAEEVNDFVVASSELGGEGHLADLLQLDSGLRLGEVAGLSWQDVWWGRDANDATRCIRVHETRPRGRGRYDSTKGGLERRVHLSRRLRSTLRARWMELSQPEEGRIVQASDQSNYRKRHFARVCRNAKIGHRRPKDLRDTFASQLLTAGVSLGYISRQLGHADASVTARYYARWIEHEVYRVPIQLRSGEVPADLLARLEGEGTPAVSGFEIARIH